MSKETFYFTHDYNARTDEKIIKLLSRHGMTGYGIFWAIVENLYNNANVLYLDYERISYDLHVSDIETIKSVIHDFGLFEIKNGSFGSASIERRLDERNEKSEKARQSAFKRWKKENKEPEKNADASENDANVSKSDAIKEKKENNTYSDFRGFWDTYDKKLGNKKNCEKKWAKLKPEEQEKIMNILPAYLKTIKDKQYQPYPETFLHERRWENEHLISGNAEVDKNGNPRPGPEYSLVNGNWSVI